MSATPRLFVMADLVKGAPVALNAEQANYLFRVLRLGVGDPVRIFNGRDGEWTAKISEAMRSAGFLTVGTQIREQASVADLELLFAPLKKARTDYVVEKATELGVSIIRPVLTQRTQTKVVRVDRLQKIAAEAAEQTERLDAPHVEEVEHLLERLGKWRAERRLIYCDEEGDETRAQTGAAVDRPPPIYDAIRDLPEGPAAILIGPEGGFTDEERARLRDLDFCLPVSLGPRVLRAETAAVAALSVWQAVKGDWRG